MIRCIAGSVSVRALGALLCSSLLLGCGGAIQTAPVPQTGIAYEPVITIDEQAGEASTEISVLIYNVAGLPWPLSRNKRSRTLDDAGNRIPISSDRPAAMREIGERLAALRQAGQAPDILLLQEAFISDSAEIPERGGYPNWVAGPSASELGAQHSQDAPVDFLEARSFWKGERLGKHQSSGLIVASNFPIVRHENYPFLSVGVRRIRLSGEQGRCPGGG